MISHVAAGQPRCNTHSLTTLTRSRGCRHIGGELLLHTSATVLGSLRVSVYRRPGHRVVVLWNMVKFSEMLPPEMQDRQLDIASKQAVRELVCEVLAALLRNKAQVLEQATSKNHPANKKSAQPSDGAGVQSIDRVLRNQNSKIDHACCSLRLRSSPARGE